MLRGAVPFVYDLFTVESTSPFSPACFTMSEYGGDIFLIDDWHTMDSYVISRVDLMEPRFDFLRWMHQQKALVCDQMLTGQEPWLQHSSERSLVRCWPGDKPVVVNYDNSDSEDGVDDEYDLTVISEEFSGFT